MSFIFLEMLSFYRDSSFEFPVLSGRNFWKNNLVKYLDKYRGGLRALSNIYYGTFATIINGFQALNILVKTSIFDVRQCSEELNSINLMKRF